MRKILYYAGGTLVFLGLAWASLYVVIWYRALPFNDEPSTLKIMLFAFVFCLPGYFVFGAGYCLVMFLKTLKRGKKQESPCE